MAQELIEMMNFDLQNDIKRVSAVWNNVKRKTSFLCVSCMSYSSVSPGSKVMTV